MADPQTTPIHLSQQSYDDLTAKVAKLEKALERVTEVLEDSDGKNDAAIIDTIWESDICTLVDFIDLALGKQHDD